MQAYDFSWQDATVNALKSFESQPSMYANPQTQLPITLPQSAYDPTFSSTTLFGYGFNDSRFVNTDIPTAYGSGRTAMGNYENAGHDRQGQRSLWGEYNLNQGFSSQAHSRAGYAGPAVYQDQDTNFQVIRMPSRLPIVPIYDNMYTSATTASDSILQADLLQSSNPNLYPQNAMPLTIKHPEFSQHGQQSAPNDDAWAAHLMNNVMRLEQHTGNAQASKQPPLTVSQSQSHAQSQPQSYTPQQPLQFTMEQINAILSQTQEMQVPDDVTQLYQQTANLHDNIAASRLNSGAKEIATLPSAIPSVPPLHSRTPAQRFAQNHPYTSPRFAPHASPRLGVGGVTAGSLRSVRPAVPRIKRESLSIPAPTTTAYLAGLRRQIPVSELASERTPVEPYPGIQQGQGSAGLAYPLSLAPGSANGNGNGGMGNAMPGSASTSSSSLPPESPFARTNSMLPNLAMPESRSRPGSVSPKKEYPQLYSPFGVGPNDGGILRFYRGTATGDGNGNAQERPGTGTTVASSSTAVSQGQAVERLQSPQMNATDRLQSQTRATAARKRADDDILQHSFRSVSDWRRRIVLEAVLSSSFVAENTLEPLSTGTGTGDAVLLGVVGSEDMGMGLGSPGKSVYAVFLEQVEKSEWRCLFGDRDHPCPSQAVAFRRLERALDHVRSHLNHRPFGCKGECQKGESCDARFFARSHLQDHVKRTESACCETCGQVIRIQNMPRHRMAH